MKIKHIIPIMAASVAFTACDKLDTYPEGSTVIETQITNENIDVMVVGLYEELIGALNTLGGTDHTDYGIPAMHMRLDSDGMDIVSEVSGYNHFNTTLAYTDRLYNSSGTLFVWYRNYKIIKACNEILKIIDPNTSSETLQGYLAETRALRAYAYFNLAQVYQFTYFGNEDKACVPIVTENMSLEEGNNNPRATVQQVYDFITADLDYAVNTFENINVSRRDKMTINGDVAHGLRARVRLVMHDYQGAKEDAERLIALYQPYSKSEVSEPTFINANDHSWIWGLIYTENSYSVQTGIINWPSHMCSLVANGYTTGGSIYRCINNNLMAEISPSDVRYGWWLDENKTSPNIMQNESYSNMVEEKDIPAYANMKFAPANYDVNTTYNTQHYPMMRVEEMILIKAECQANLGEIGDANETLTNFVKGYRSDDYSCNASTADEMTDAIWLQRRIELWGEGFAFLDIMRLNKDVDRSNSNFPIDYQWTVKAGSPILLYRIPKDEIEANNGISDKDNNPSAELPTVK